MVLLKSQYELDIKATNKLLRPIPDYDHSELDYRSSSSFTTSSFAPDVSATSDSSTLSMISTPWSTDDSWDKPYTNMSPSEYWYTEDTSTSVRPVSISSYGNQSSDVRSTSKITLAVLSKQNSPSISKASHIKAKSKDEDVSTWTMESFTSTGLLPIEPPKLVEPITKLKVKYPWSPSTYASDLELTDSYPDSWTLVSQKGSRQSLSTNSMDAIKENLTPMNCVINTSTLECNPFLDWILVKRTNCWVIDRKVKHKKNSKNN